MTEDIKLSKRLKLDLSNNYTFPHMKNNPSAFQTEKPIAATVTEFLENHTLFRPSNEYINTTLPDEETVLTHCIKNQFVEAVEALVDAGSDPNLSSRKGVTPISAAAHKGNVIIMEKLIIAGAAVNAVNQSGSTALIQAAHFGHLNAVKLLLRYNAAPDFANVKGTTALMRACQEGHYEISRCLVNASVEVNRKNNEGMNALMLASQRGHWEIVTLLVRMGATMDEQTTQGSTALMLACKRGHDKCAEVLVTMGAEICMKDRRGRTAKDTATKRNHLGLLCWLDTQVQVQQIQKNRHQMRQQHLAAFRVAATKEKLVLNPVEATVASLCESVKKLTADSSLFQKTNKNDDIVMDAFMSSSQTLPFVAADPQMSLDLISSVYTNDINAVIRKLPVFNHSSKSALTFPGHAEWQWSALLLHVMGLPPGVFELVIDYMPMPRIWQWTLTRVKLRCKLCPLQAMLDISTVMDEILCDANIICNSDQTQLLVKINRSPQMHEYLMSNMGMTPELLSSLCEWSQIQGLLTRAQETDLVFKPAIARKMLVVAISLYRWYRQNQSAVKKLNLVLPVTAVGSVDEIEGLNGLRLNENDLSALAQDAEDDGGDLMEETDAGGEGSEDNDGDEGGLPAIPPQQGGGAVLLLAAGAGGGGIPLHNIPAAVGAVGGGGGMAVEDDDDDEDGENLQLDDSDNEGNGVEAMMFLDPLP